MVDEINEMLNILSSFLGKPKSDDFDLHRQLQFEFNCPKCAEENNGKEDCKYNLAVNLSKDGGVFQCWKCSTHSDEMKGKIKKLFQLYGNDNLWKQYKDCIYSLKNSELYKLNFHENDFILDEDEIKTELNFPFTYKKLYNLQNINYYDNIALNYLQQRGLSASIIEKYQIGYTTWDNRYPINSNRIIIPSYDEYGDLNYWVGRDFTKKSFIKYNNPKCEKKNIIFCENLINWDNDITLCEGIFDAMVIPNSICLLGKALNKTYKVYEKLFEKCNGNINIFLDGDEAGVNAAETIYKNLNHSRLYGKIRYVEPIENLDPSEIYQKYGKRGIIHCLKNNTYRLDELFLI